MSRARILALAGLCAVLAPAAWADEVMPDGCTHHLTVQMRGCLMARHYTCDATGGDRWAVLHNQDGAFLVSRIDADAHWVSTQELETGIQTQVLPDPGAPTSISNLMDTGYDAFVFDERIEDLVIRYEGFDRLTGEEVEIDGEPLMVTNFRYRVIHPETGRILSMTEGQEFVSRRHNRFFSGVRTFTNSDGDETTDHTPMEFIYPGERGFEARTAIHGCGAMMSSLLRAEDHA